MINDLKNLEYVLKNQKHNILRNPETCICLMKCKQAYRLGSSFLCRKTQNINDVIAKRIEDYRMACTAKKAPWNREELQVYLSNAHNFCYSEDDYFPNHLVPKL